MGIVTRHSQGSRCPPLCPSRKRKGARKGVRPVGFCFFPLVLHNSTRSMAGCHCCGCCRNRLVHFITLAGEIGVAAYLIISLTISVFVDDAEIDPFVGNETVDFILGILTYIIIILTAVFAIVALLKKNVGWIVVTTIFLNDTEITGKVVVDYLFQLILITVMIVAFVFLLSYKSAKSTAKGGGGETDFL